MLGWPAGMAPKRKSLGGGGETPKSKAAKKGGVDSAAIQAQFPHIGTLIKWHLVMTLSLFCFKKKAIMGHVLFIAAVVCPGCGNED